MTSGNIDHLIIDQHYSLTLRNRTHARALAHSPQLAAVRPISSCVRGFQKKSPHVPVFLRSSSFDPDMTEDEEDEGLIDPDR